MTAFSRLGTALSGILVGLGVAVLARTVHDVGFHRFVLGHIVGPGLILTGLMRMKLQRHLTRDSEENDDGNPS
ncbi:MAG: hypothetical protein JWN41_1496 [Thermoleophilia bacterium]|nr:hypothetical protein [Thermoleophilia bacterium]